MCLCDVFGCKLGISKHDLALDMSRHMNTPKATRPEPSQGAFGGGALLSRAECLHPNRKEAKQRTRPRGQGVNLPSDRTAFRRTADSPT